MKRPKTIYSQELGINLKSQKESELFKWFLVCLLFGKPIQQQVARRAYLEFEKQGLITPNAILDAGWDKLVEVLDQGHYVRYDFSTASKILETCKKLQRDYGSVSSIIKQSKNKSEIQKKLLDFKGIGPKTVEIFLRDIKF